MSLLLSVRASFTVTERLAGWSTSVSVISQVTCVPLGAGVGVGLDTDGTVHEGLAALAVVAATVKAVALATAARAQAVARTAMRLDLCILTASVNVTDRDGPKHQT